MDNDAPEVETPGNKGAKLKNVNKQQQSCAKSARINNQVQMHQSNQNESQATIQSTGSIMNTDNDEVKKNVRNKARLSSQKQKSTQSPKGNRGKNNQTFERNPRSCKISKFKNQNNKTQQQPGNFKKPFETKRHNSKKVVDSPAEADSYALKDVENISEITKGPLQDQKQHPSTQAQQALNSLQTIGTQLNSKITSMFGCNTKKNSKIAYNDSNFNPRKKQQTTEQEEQNNLIADLKSKLQALKEGKFNIQTDQLIKYLSSATGQQFQEQLSQADQSNLLQKNLIQTLQSLQNQNEETEVKENQISPTQVNFDERYIHLKEVGKGTFGSVIKAIDTKECQAQSKNIYKLITASSQQPDASNQYQDSSNFVAIKKLFYDRRYEQRELTTLNEIKDNNLCSNIIEVKDQFFRMEADTGDCGKKKSSGTSSTLQKKEYLFIVTDYLPYTINDLKIYPQNIQCDQSKFLCLESIKQVMQGVFLGLRDLHSLGITHRDIKLCNILIDNNQYPILKVKICDFGSSKRLVSDPNNQSTQSISYIGTRSFRAPELLVGNQYYDSKIDIWSAGVIFLKLIFKYMGKKIYMFDVKDTKSLSKVIQYFIGSPTETELKEMNATNQMMTCKLGQTDDENQKKRFKKFDAYMGDKISADCIDLLHKIFELSPVRRISADEILRQPFFLKTQVQPTGNKSSVQTKQSNINRTTESTSPALNSYVQFQNKKVYQ